MRLSKQRCSFFGLLLLVFLVTACKPVATSQTVYTAINSPVDIVLTGTDADGDDLTFRVVEPPLYGSLSGSEPNLTYTPDPEFTGEDKFSFVANDGTDDSTPKFITIIVEDNQHAPVPVVENRVQVVPVGSPALIDASMSFDIERDDFGFNWVIESAPENGMPETVDLQSDTLAFTPREPGVYKLKLQLQDQTGRTSELPVVIVTNAYKFHGLDFLVTDAEYDEEQDRIVMVSSEPPALHLYSLETRQLETIPLSSQPTSVSVWKNEAVVGHNGSLTHVSLLTNSIIKEVATSINVFDVINVTGLAHIMPPTGQWVSMRTIDLASGEETVGQGIVRAGTVIKRHPSGNYAYGADRGLSPSDIEKYDISTNQVKRLYDSPYHGDFSMCGNLWLDDTGKRIFTRCGNVFTSSESSDLDMRYKGKLETIGWLRWVSGRAGKLYSIDSNDDKINIHEDAFLTLKDAYALPLITVGTTEYSTHGRFVFAHTNGLSHSGLVQVNTDSGLLYDWGVVTMSPELVTNQLPEAVIDGSGSVIAGTSIQLSGKNSVSGEGTDLSYFWKLVGTPAGSNTSVEDFTKDTLTINTDVEGDYHVMLVVHDGENYSYADIFTIHAINTGSEYSVPLDFQVVDAEYIEATDKLVFAASNPNQLVVLDPVTLEQWTLPLPLVPTVVATSLDGLTAVVGHNGWLTHINLENKEAIGTYSVSTNVFDLVVTNGYAHAMPRTDQWEHIRSINLSTGEEFQQSGYSVRAGTVMKLHPSGDYAYGADRGLSPSDIEKYDLRSGPAKMMYDSPYHGTYSMCGNLWVGEDGLRIITGCGNIFRSSTDRSLDMTYNGSLTGVSGIQWVSSTSEQDEMMVLNNTNKVTTFQYSNTLPLDEFELPQLSVGGSAFNTRGVFGFYNSSGDRKIFVLKAENSGLTNEFAVYVR
ncbi:MAG: Ig-like domain-containing protein [Ketobacteraceae bacterium]|nr:Ig-like domain-containing protein [Ketobacteraceae bacterium]